MTVLGEWIRGKYVCWEWLRRSNFSYSNLGIQYTVTKCWKTSRNRYKHIIKVDFKDQIHRVKRVNSGYPWGAGIWEETDTF